jgi:hypothetical protein
LPTQTATVVVVASAAAAVIVFAGISVLAFRAARVRRTRRTEEARLALDAQSKLGEVALTGNPLYQHEAPPL